MKRRGGKESKKAVHMKIGNDVRMKEETNGKVCSMRDRSSEV